LADQRKKKRRR